jgi:hypothetical protein
MGVVVAGLSAPSPASLIKNSQTASLLPNSVVKVPLQVSFNSLNLFIFTYASAYPVDFYIITYNNSNATLSALESLNFSNSTGQAGHSVLNSIPANMLSKNVVSIVPDSKEGIFPYTQNFSELGFSQPLYQNLNASPPGSMLYAIYRNTGNITTDVSYDLIEQNLNVTSPTSSVGISSVGGIFSALMILAGIILAIIGFVTKRAPSVPDDEVSKIYADISKKVPVAKHSQKRRRNKKIRKAGRNRK